MYAPFRPGGPTDEAQLVQMRHMISASLTILREIPRVMMVTTNSKNGAFRIAYRLEGGDELVGGADGYVMVGATAIFYRVGEDEA
jgi:hypothetical protein